MNFSMSPGKPSLEFPILKMERLSRNSMANQRTRGTVVQNGMNHTNEEPIAHEKKLARDPSIRLPRPDTKNSGLFRVTELTSIIELQHSMMSGTSCSNNHTVSSVSISLGSQRNSGFL